MAERARRFGIGAAILTLVLYAVAGVVLAHLVNGYVITTLSDHIKRHKDNA